MSTSHKQNVDKFAAAMEVKRLSGSAVKSAQPLNRPTAQPLNRPTAQQLNRLTAQPLNPKATFLPPILCVECPGCHSRVHPRVRTFERADGYDVVRGMCPNCGGTYWVYNREQEQFNKPAGATPRGSVRYVYKP